MPTENMAYTTRPDEQNPYWISFSDIMAGLLVIFILAVVLLILQIKQRQVLVDEAILEMARTNALREEILNGIKEELAKKGIRVVISENNTVLRISDELLAFESSKFEIPEQSEWVVEEIGHAIYSQITMEDRLPNIDTIFIEGHTDSRPAPWIVNGLGNWGLSSARAISIWKFWSEELPISEQMIELRNSRGERLFSVSGYGATRRAVEDDALDASAQKANRRIDIRFSMRTPVLKDFETIRTTLQ